MDEETQPLFHSDGIKKRQKETKKQKNKQTIKKTERRRKKKEASWSEGS